MATYTGAILKGVEHALNEHSQDALQAPRTSPQATRSGLDNETPDLGLFGLNQPISIRNVPKSGVQVRSFFDDYYNRVYFLPAVIDFGPVSNEVSRPLRVWNAHLHPATLEQIASSQASGLSLNGPATPVTFKALAVKDWTLTALADGPPSISATFTWYFEGASVETHTIPVTGSRARISPLRPNWREPFRVTYEFKTDIMVSHTGKEQRRAVRASPRKKIDFVATVSRRASRFVNENMAFWHSRSIILAEEPRAAVSSIGMAPTMNFIQLDEAPPLWAVVGANVMLTYRQEIQETRKIEAIDANILLFDSISATEFPPGTKVMAAVTGTFPQQLVSKRHTDTTHEYAVTLNVTPTSEVSIPLSAPDLVFNDREVWLQQPNWGEIPEVTHEQPVSQVDYGRGKIARFMPVEFATRINKFNYIGRDFEEADKAREFFYRMRGQRGECYMPTWENDLIPVLPSLVGSNYIRTAGLSILDNYENDPIHRAICVFPRDGSAPLLRVIDSIYKVSDEQGVDTALQIAGDPWPYEISYETIRMISWMPVWRLASDSFELTWRTNTVAQYAFTMRTLEDLP